MSERTKTILIADDDQDLLHALEQRCRQMGLNVVAVSDAREALNAAVATDPDVICMDVELPGGNGLAVSEMFQSDARLQHIPLVIVTGSKDCEVERRCNQLPAYFIPKSSNTWGRLEPLLRELLNGSDDKTDRCTSAATPHAMAYQKDDDIREAPAAKRWGRNDSPHATEDLLDVVFALMGGGESIVDDLITARPWVLCVDDDRDFSTVLARRLESKGIGVLNAFDGKEGCQLAYSQPANAIVLDYNMPNGQGDYVLRRLRENPVTKHIPVLVLTGNKDDAVRRQMLSLGADAFLFKPLSFDLLLEELSSYIDIPSDDGLAAIGQ